LFLRTRDPKILDQCDTVVDVGGVFNAEQRRFDHHQKYVLFSLEARSIDLFV
jgi:uncharacterized UPF0160 family protein